MIRLPVLAFLFICLLACASEAIAWTDDVEGMLMPAEGYNDPMADPQVILDNVEGSPESAVNQGTPVIEWE